MYTKEKSAAISIHEFQALQSNFPFIENFSVLDENKWVVVYKEVNFLQVEHLMSD